MAKHKAIPSAGLKLCIWTTLLQCTLISPVLLIDHKDRQTYININKGYLGPTSVCYHWSGSSCWRESGAHGAPLHHPDCRCLETLPEEWAKGGNRLEVEKTIQIWMINYSKFLGKLMGSSSPCDLVTVKPTAKPMIYTHKTILGSS